MASSLAIFGGPRAVTKRRRDRARRVHFKAAARLALLMAADKNTASSGRDITRFERRFAAMTGSRYALTMNSGTSALHAAYFAVGVRPGDEVVVPAYTFFASASPILQCGATPVFCDIDPETLTADPDDVERRVTEKTRAICVVHVWGNPARMDRFVDISRRRGLALIEDASHAHGATFCGQHVGTFGDVGCFSLQGNKAVSGGELGIAVTDDSLIHDKMLALGLYGRGNEQITDALAVERLSLGLKYRPHLYGVALANASLDHLPNLNRRRARNYALLSEALDGCGVLRPIATYPGAERGGFLEFLFAYEPELASGIPVGGFVKAANAEGVPAFVDRYTRIGERARLLCEAPMFCDTDWRSLGGALSGVGPIDTRPASELVPVADRMADRLVKLIAISRVPESYVRQLGTGLRKVADGLRGITDFRTGARPDAMSGGRP